MSDLPKKRERVIFFARSEASVFGSPQIEPEHLLLALFREDGVLKSHLELIEDAQSSIRAQIEARVTVRPHIPTSVDLP